MRLLETWLYSPEDRLLLFIADSSRNLFLFICNLLLKFSSLFFCFRLLLSTRPCGHLFSFELFAPFGAKYLNWSPQLQYLYLFSYRFSSVLRSHWIGAVIVGCQNYACWYADWQWYRLVPSSMVEMLRLVLITTPHFFSFNQLNHRLLNKKIVTLVLVKRNPLYSYAQLC